MIYFDDISEKIDEIITQICTAIKYTNDGPMVGAFKSVVRELCCARDTSNFYIEEFNEEEEEEEEEEE